MKKLFGTDGVRGKANIYPMNAETALKLGKAAAAVFMNGKKRHKIVIGKDTRISCYMIENALTSGILSMGVDVLLVGPMPTPAIAHLTKSFAADAGIVISASHNPAEDNGIKFFDSNGFKLSDEIEEKIEKIAFSEIKTDHIIGELVGRAKRIDDAQGRYIEFAKSSVDNISLKGIKIVLDCANGAAYKVSPLIFEELGAQVVTINNTPNGLNINDHCGALYPEQMKKFVVQYGADIGIALDGDADRVIMVDENANDVDGDQIMALCALNLIRDKKLKDNTIVVTEYSNLGLDKAIKNANGKVIRVMNGDRYVVEEMRKHKYNFGGEQSGHIVFLDYTTTGDGTISALQVLRIMKKTGKKLSELAKCITKFPQLMVNVKVRKKIDFEKMPRVMEKINKAKEKLKNNGRVIVRYSGTQNLARIMAEGINKKEIRRYAKEIADEIKKGAC
ncbi:phosphoglucosamine mutase [Candidatus Woesearchaeota archaeon CG1_02_33_12]|nr:MAG: phosphoglucosamine mutase [Candidatus Woesearchaeota archaeon CG1_02_33_12]PIN78033.1 MAG: phosphoglucosamine mutase [Candidatus Woesearchaeota archaeon CG10_big_fil_rev_8_21_14_0_10_33_12]